MNKDNITKGEVELDKYGSLRKVGDNSIAGVGVYGVSLTNNKEAKANRDLLLEAHNVFTESNQTPRELMEANKEFIDLLKAINRQGINSDFEGIIALLTDVRGLIKKHSTK